MKYQKKWTLFWIHFEKWVKKGVYVIAEPKNSGLRASGATVVPTDEFVNLSLYVCVGKISILASVPNYCSCVYLVQYFAD